MFIRVVFKNFSLEYIRHLESLNMNNRNIYFVTNNILTAQKLFITSLLFCSINLI